MTGYNSRKEIVAVTALGEPIEAIYLGNILIWLAIRSCFGAGYWDNSKPWLNEEAYKN